MDLTLVNPAGKGGRVVVAIPDEDMDTLGFKDFCERYLRPMLTAVRLKAERVDA